MNPTNIPGVCVVSVQKNDRHIGPNKTGHLEEVLNPGDRVNLKVVVENGYNLKKIVRLDGKLIAVDGQAVTNGTQAFWKICKVTSGRNRVGHVEASEAMIRFARADEKSGKFCIYQVWLATTHGGNMVDSNKAQSWQFYRGHTGQLICVDLKASNPEMYELASKFFANTSSLPHISAWKRAEEEASSGLHALLM